MKAEQQTVAALAVSCHLGESEIHGHRKISNTKIVAQKEKLYLCGEHGTQCDIISGIRLTVLVILLSKLLRLLCF